jgi:hypothetical protein
MPQLPTLTATEMEQMRQKAAAARAAKAAALGEVKTGALPITAALAGEDARLVKAKVRRVLLALPGVGDGRATGSSGCGHPRDAHGQGADFPSA